MYTTIADTIGALLPFTSKEDVDFFQHLEMYLRWVTHRVPRACVLVVPLLWCLVLSCVVLSCFVLCLCSVVRLCSHPPGPTPAARKPCSGGPGPLVEPVRVHSREGRRGWRPV